MRTNGKYRMNRKPMSSDEINRMQDFDAVLKGANAAGPKGGNGGGGFSSWLYVAGGAVLMTAAVLTWISLPSDKDNAISRQVEQNIPETMPRTQEDSEDTVRAPLVRLPVKEWQTAFSSYTLQAEKGGIIQHPGGTKISIPASCLMDEKGNTISGPVEFRYREFFDPIEIALSGITMKYDSAGTEYYFETGGMCELRAFQNGVEVKMKPQKNIEVSMPAKIEGDFNLYYLDEDKGWQARGNSKKTGPKKQDAEQVQTNPVIQEGILGRGELVSTENEPLTKVQQEIKQLETQKPKAPRKADINRPRFNLDIDLKDFPELSDFKNMQFEIAPEDKVFSTALYKVQWNDVKLKRHSSTRYKMVLTKDANGKQQEQVVELIVIPVIDEKDFGEAEKKYKELLDAYEGKVAAKKAEEARLLKEAEEALRKAQLENEKRLKKQNEELRMESEIRHVFSMDGFGIWNNDNPRIKPKRIIQARFVTPDGQPITSFNAKVVLPRKKGLIDIHHSGSGTYGIHDVGDKYSYVFFLLDDKKIAVKKVSELNPEEGQVIMPVSERSFESAKEIKEYIYQTLGQ